MKRLAALLTSALLIPACGGTYHAPGQPAPAAPEFKSIAPFYVGMLSYPNSHPVAWPYVGQLPEMEAKHYAQINDARAARGLAPLEPDLLAIEGARAHAWHQVLHSFGGDRNPEGEDAFDRYLQMGAWYRKLIEISGRVVDPALVLPSEEIFSTEVNHIGVGIWNEPATGLYTVVYDLTWR